VVELIADADADAPGADLVSETAADIAARGVGSESARPFVVEIEAIDRQGLLRDVLQVLDRLSMQLMGNAGRLDHGRGLAILRLEMPSCPLRERALLIDSLNLIDGLREARVVRAPAAGA
ncbi:MAG: hypothetical protein ACKOBM_10470, partial [Gammaproteobacteria bacterium]